MKAYEPSVGIGVAPGSGTDRTTRISSAWIHIALAYPWPRATRPLRPGVPSGLSSIGSLLLQYHLHDDIIGAS